jgi:hypothetical protein
MGTRLNFYIGPYIETATDFDWYEWERLVSCVIEENGDDDLILTINSYVDGIERELHFGFDSEMDVEEIGTDTIGTEKLFFKAFAQDLIRHLEESGIDFKIKWGIVPYIC